MSNYDDEDYVICNNCEKEILQEDAIYVGGKTAIVMLKSLRSLKMLKILKMKMRTTMIKMILINFYEQFNKKPHKH